MKGVRVDPKMKTARTQGGVIWNEFDRETPTFDLVTTDGTMSTTGADCMSRNLTGRVEAIAPIEHPALMAELRTYLDLQLADRGSAWEMQSDGSYVQRTPEREDQISSQNALIDRATGGGMATSDSPTKNTKC